MGLAQSQTQPGLVRDQQSLALALSAIFRFHFTRGLHSSHHPGQLGLEWLLWQAGNPSDRKQGEAGLFLPWLEAAAGVPWQGAPRALSGWGSAVLGPRTTYRREKQPLPFRQWLADS